MFSEGYVNFIIICCLLIFSFLCQAVVGWLYLPSHLIGDLIPTLTFISRAHYTFYSSQYHSSFCEISYSTLWRFIVICDPRSEIYTPTGFFLLVSVEDYLMGWFVCWRNFTLIWCLPLWSVPVIKVLTHIPSVGSFWQVLDCLQHQGALYQLVVLPYWPWLHCHWPMCSFWPCASLYLD